MAIRECKKCADSWWELSLKKPYLCLRSTSFLFSAFSQAGLSVQASDSVTETLPNGFYSTFTAEAPPSSITPMPALSVAVYPSCGREAISSLHMVHEMNLHLVSEQSSLITAA